MITVRTCWVWRCCFSQISAAVISCESSELSSFLSHFLSPAFDSLSCRSAVQEHRRSCLWPSSHEKTSLCVCVSSKAWLQYNNKRCNGHHDTMNLSSVYCVCWTVIDRLTDERMVGRPGQQADVKGIHKCLRDMGSLIIIPVNGHKISIMPNINWQSFHCFHWKLVWCLIWGWGILIQEFRLQSAIIIKHCITRYKATYFHLSTVLLSW